MAPVPSTSALRTGRPSQRRQPGVAAFAVAQYEAVVAVLGLSGYLTHAQQVTLDNFAQQLI